MKAIRFDLIPFGCKFYYKKFLYRKVFNPSGHNAVLLDVPKGFKNHKVYLEKIKQGETYRFLSYEICKLPPQIKYNKPYRYEYEN